MNKRLYLSPPNMAGNELNYIHEAFDTNWISPLGPNVEAFEKAVCDYTGANHALALSSCTGAIHLALKYLEVKQGDLVFCSTLTFAASCNPIMYEKAVPVFIDSERDTWNMDPKCLQMALEKYEKLGRLPKACIVVNLYGQSAKMDEIMALCNQYEVPVIEDAAESLGAMYKGKQSGTYGDIGVYSFNGNKIITTSGGGMMIASDELVIDKCKFWATQAREPELHYEHKEIGYNYRMSNICAGIGRGQMEVLDQFIEAKKTVYKRYEKGFDSIDTIKMMPIDGNGEPNYWLSVMLIEESSGVKPVDIIARLTSANIESRPLWKPMHQQPIYREYDYISIEDVSDELFKEGICLPSGSSMTQEEQSLVIEIICDAFKERS